MECPMTDDRLKLIVTRRDMHGPDIVVVELKSADGADLPPFEPGSHVDVEVAPGLNRQYSLCGDPHDRTHYRLGILKTADSRGGSREAHTLLTLRKTVRISKPRNHFPLHPAAKTSILIAGGIGVTPILAMALDLYRRGENFVLHYCARSRGAAAFVDELESAPFALQVVLHFDDGASEQRFDPARDVPRADAGTHVYFCGPAGFMQWVESGCRELGYASAQLHQEHFSAEVSTAGGSFEVQLARTGIVVPVPEGVSIVKALEGAGVKVETMCGQGVCGTCLCDVLEGLPDHRDSYLTDEEHRENTQMTLCCSRSLSKRLVLDL
ncbi:MAG TPA: PDR/VanB family oxidoreductase [Pseudolabrys sp.]|nr:PDR/VanB family oxidoreductase [Pseudolabrys sp.]